MTSLVVFTLTFCCHLCLVYTDCPEVTGYLGGPFYSLGSIKSRCYILVNNTFQCDGKVLAWKYKIGGGYNDQDLAYATVWHPLKHGDAYRLMYTTPLPLNKRYVYSII